MFWDSDLAKSIETGAYSLHCKPHPERETPAHAVIALHGRLQAEDGCLDSFFLRIKPEWRWTNLRDFHELYCAGHVIEATAAHVQATGKRKSLDIMGRMADLLARRLGRGPGQVPGYDGHEEVELALVKLARVTGSQAFHGPRQVLRGRARAGAEVLRRGGTRPRPRPEGVAAERRDVQPVPPARASCGRWTSTRAWPMSRPSTTTTAVPDLPWDNRQPGEMLVWVREARR